MDRRMVRNGIHKVGTGIEKIQGLAENAAHTLKDTARDSAGHLINHVPGEQRIRRIASGLLSVVSGQTKQETNEEQTPLEQIIEQMAKLQLASLSHIPSEPNRCWSYQPTHKTGTEHRSPWIQVEDTWLQIGFTELPSKRWVDVDYPPVENLQRMFAVIRDTAPEGGQADATKGSYATIQLQPPVLQGEEKELETPFAIDPIAVEQVQGYVAQYTAAVEAAR